MIVELKAAEALLPVHFAQVDTYLRVTGLQVALLINFYAAALKGNIHRRVNSRP